MNNALRGARAWLALALVVVLIDQLTKAFVLAGLVLYQPVPLIPGFNLTLVYNPGAAFSFLSKASGWQRWFLSALAGVISIVLVVWLLRVPRGQTTLAAALALVLGGAVGNLIDRVRLGYVIDFVDMYYRSWHWPAFNVADAAITVGAGLLVLTSLRPTREPLH